MLCYVYRREFADGIFSVVRRGETIVTEFNNFFISFLFGVSTQCTFCISIPIIPEI